MDDSLNKKPEKFHMTSGVVLLKDVKDPNTDVLMIFRKWRFAPEGAYILPKGHVEEGESFEEAAVRETTEETGYKNIEIVEFLNTITFQYDDGGFRHEKTVHWFLGLLKDEEMVPVALSHNESKFGSFETCWIPLQKSITMTTFKTDKEPLLKAIEYFKSI